jgi:hypothetical protein
MEPACWLLSRNDRNGSEFAQKFAWLARISDFLDIAPADARVYRIDEAFLLEASMIQDASHTRSSSIPERELDLISGYVSVFLAIGAVVVGVASMLH